MGKRASDTEIWKKDWFLDLTDKQKLLVKFLFDNCDCAGIYEISKRMLKTCFEEPITKEDFLAIKQVKFINENTIFIEDFIRFQYRIDISELNEKYNLHKGIIRRLNKYGLFSTLPLPLSNPTPRVQEQEQYKEKEKDIYNTNTYKDIHISNNINNNKTDPYINKTNSIFREEYKKVFNSKPYLMTNQRNKLAELSAEIENFTDTIPIVLEKLKNVEFSLPNFTANYIWLLTEDNYIKVLSGTYDKKKSEWDIYCEERGVDEYGN